MFVKSSGFGDGGGLVEFFFQLFDFIAGFGNLRLQSIGFALIMFYGGQNLCFQTTDDFIGVFEPVNGLHVAVEFVMLAFGFVYPAFDV